MSTDFRDRMRYEPPEIAQRESLRGLLTVVSPSDKPGTISDVRVKRNVRPVRW